MQEIPVFFDEAVYEGKESSCMSSNLEEEGEIDVEEEEEKLPPLMQDNFKLNQNRLLNDIKEDPEEYQNFEGSSSLQSNYVRKMLSNEEFKMSSNLTKHSKEEESENYSQKEHKTSFCLKSSKIEKKGIFFFNERILTLKANSRLSYISHGIEKEIDLNPTTSVRQVTEFKFEITNHHPTTKYLFRTQSCADCEDWVLLIKRQSNRLF